MVELLHHLTKKEGPMSNVTLLGIDLPKNVFQLHGVDSKGNTLLRKKISRAKLLETIANLPSCTIVMEACGGETRIPLGPGIIPKAGYMTALISMLQENYPLQTGWVHT